MALFMKRRRLLWQIYPTYLFITLLTLFVVALQGARFIQRFQSEQALENLKREAVLIADELEKLPGALESATTDQTCKKLGRQTLTRITVILPDGRVGLRTRGGARDRQPVAGDPGPAGFRQRRPRDRTAGGGPAGGTKMLLENDHKYFIDAYVLTLIS